MYAQGLNGTRIGRNQSSTILAEFKTPDGAIETMTHSGVRSVSKSPQFNVPIHWIASIITKVEWCDRVVGTSRLSKGLMRPLWIGTGNNTTMTAELARRVVRCRLDAGVERPFLRGGFTHADLRGW